MTRHEAFRLALLENPTDDARRLIYADWLEEQGDPRGQFIRAYPEIYTFIAGLKGFTEVYSPFALLQGYASRGQADLLQGLALALEAHGEDDTFNPQLPGVVRGMIEHIERQLAIVSGPGNAATLLAMVGSGPIKTSKIRQVASMLASGHGPDVLVPLIEKHGGDERLFELFACLINEIVLRGASLRGNHAIERFAERMRSGNHPLAWLPMGPTELEAEVAPWLPRYGSSGSTSGTAYSLGANSERELRARSPSWPEAREVDVTDRMLATVKGWRDESNGQIEARVFELDSAINRDQLCVAFLRSLGLESLEGDVYASWITPVVGFNVLFSAASVGGAYGAKLEGAYGRLAAWQSLSGLVGAREGERGDELVATARECDWVFYTTSNGWFYNVGPDLALVVVRPDGRSLAILAATDTD